MPESLESELARLRRRNAELETAVLGALEELLAPRSLLERLERLRGRLSPVTGGRPDPPASGG